MVNEELIAMLPEFLRPLCRAVPAAIFSSRRCLPLGELIQEA